WDHGNWLSFHTLTVVWAISALVAVCLERAIRPQWTTIFGGLVTLLAIRASLESRELLLVETIWLASFVLLTQLIAWGVRPAATEDVERGVPFLIPQIPIALIAVILTFATSIIAGPAMPRLIGPLGVCLVIGAAGVAASSARRQWRRDL